MILLRGLVALLLLTGAALAQGTTISNLPAATIPLDGSEYIPCVQGGVTKRCTTSRPSLISVKDYGAVGNTLSYSDGTITAGTAAFSSATATFTAADIGKAITVDGAGAAGVPLVTTIAGFTSAHAVTLTANAVTTVPYSLTGFAAQATAQSGGGSYAPADTITLTGGTAVTQSVLTIVKTQAFAATINAAGSGGTNGACLVRGTTGVGTLFALNVTISGGAITAIGSFLSGGHYTTNPTSLAAEPVTGCGLTGATLAVTMGVDAVKVTTQGNYSVAPSNPVSQGSTSGSGTGATFTLKTLTAGTYSYGADDSAAFTAAINRANTLVLAGQPAMIYAPAGIYRVVSTLPRFVRNGGIMGDGPDKTFIRIDSSYSGDLFSWADAWITGTFPTQTATPLLQNSTVGPQISNITVVGTATAPTAQNAFVFYDHNDFVNMHDVDIYYVRGRSLYMGPALNDPTSYLRESSFANVRAIDCGDADKPCVELTSTGSGNGSDEINFYNINIFASNGPGLVVHNSTPNQTLYNVNFFGLRVEGVAASLTPLAAADLITIGDPALAGTVSDVRFYGLRSASSNTNFCTIRVTGASSALQPYNILVDGQIGPGNGSGLCIDAGRSIKVRLYDIAATGTGLVVGPSSLVGANIRLDMDGREQVITTNVDSTSAGNVCTMAGRCGDPAVAGGTVSPVWHNTTTTFGNALGANAVDLQTNRNGAVQAATGSGAAILGGQFNTASGISSTVIGGSSSVSSGARSVVAGVQASDGSRQGVNCYAAGQLAAVGDAQGCTGIFFGTGATASAFRVTSGGGAASGTNCFNIPNNTAYALSVTIMAFDHTTVTKNETWLRWGMLLTRGANAAATALITETTPTPLTNGTLTGSAIAAAADTTNGCLNISFTPPTSNTDTWNVVAKVESVEVK